MERDRSTPTRRRILTLGATAVGVVTAGCEIPEQGGDGEGGESDGGESDGGEGGESDGEDGGESGGEEGSEEEGSLGRPGSR